jgi:hypothetical protein
MKRCVYRRTNARWLVMAASLMVVAACSGATAGRSSTPAAASTAASSPVEEATPTPASSTNPGASSIDGSVIGGSNHPSYTVEASDPWSSYKGSFVTNHTAGVTLGLSVWDVGRVPRNPCHPLGHLYDPGPTVDDLVAALAAQPMRNATTPTDVTLGGYRGRYLVWSVPAHMVVTGDADFAGCDVQSNGHRDFVSWLGNGEGERYEQVAGQVDRLWVLNVLGQRLLVDATYSPNTTQAQRRALGQIAKSLRFVAPGTT